MSSEARIRYEFAPMPGRPERFVWVEDAVWAMMTDQQRQWFFESMRHKAKVRGALQWVRDGNFNGTESPMM